MTTENNNPYVESEKDFDVKKSIVVLVDILGYKDLIIDAKRNGTEREKLNELKRCTYEPYRNLNFSKDGLFGKNRFEVKTFSDNVVIGYPIQGEGELEFSSILDNVSAFQLSMTIGGSFIRGALTVGNIYMDQDITFGSGLLEAYETEKSIAVTPRVVLTDVATEYHDKLNDFFKYTRRAPKYYDVLRDADGKIFVNYLNILFVAGIDMAPFTGELKSHGRVVTKKLKLYENSANYYSKYMWTAKYHNFFCDLHKEYYGDEYKINIPFDSTGFELLNETT